MTAFDLDEVAEIVDGLVNSTTAGKLQWSPYQDAGELQASTSRFTFYIKARDDDDAPPWQFQIYSRGERSGLLVEIVTTRDEPVLVAKIGTLFSTAKLSVHGIASLKNEVLDDLSSI